MTVTPTERPTWAASVVKFSRRPRVWPAASLALIAVLVLTSATASLARTAGAQPANPQAQTVEFTFTSTYDGSTQQAVMQVPTAYQAGQATPLLIVLHDWKEDRLPPFNDFKTAADYAGWLLASPDMHGETSPQVPPILPGTPGLAGQPARHPRYHPVGEPALQRRSYPDLYRGQRHGRADRSRHGRQTPRRVRVRRQRSRLYQRGLLVGRRGCDQKGADRGRGGGQPGRPSPVGNAAPLDAQRVRGQVQLRAQLLGHPTAACIAAD